jgi:hypothetical protein
MCSWITLLRGDVKEVEGAEPFVWVVIGLFRLSLD